MTKKTGIPKGLLLLLTISFSAVPSNVLAQRNANVEWTEVYDKMFLERTPLIDDYAPNVSAFDEQGNEFDFSRTQGKHTVIVFGCLT